MKKVIFVLSILGIVLSACGTSSEEKVAPKTTTPAPASTSKTIVAAEEDGKQIVLLTAGDDMKYNAKEIQAKAGVPVSLTLKHTGKMPKTTMGHNVVILQPETDVTAFVNRANAAQATDYIPQEYLNQIVAHTKMLSGGESDTITFTFEKPGTYVFLCSFIGHAGIMKGKFIIE